MSLDFVVVDRVTALLAADVAASATTWTLRAGEGARFPTIPAGKYVPVFAEVGLSTWEKVHVTARSGDVLTVQRAQDGTTALDLNAQATRLVVTIGSAEIGQIRDAIVALQ
jgi:hypothetical protein